MKFAPVPSTAYNFSDAELCRHVRHHYPNVSGPLEQILIRLEHRYAEPQPAEAKDAVECACPHCGSPFETEE